MILTVPKEFLAQVKGRKIRDVEVTTDGSSIALTLRLDKDQSAELLVEHRHSARAFFMAGPEDEQVHEYPVRRKR